MSKSRYRWTLGDPLPTLASHSRAKHEILSDYIAQYVEVLTANPRQEQLRLTLVDGFAGGGRYRDDATNLTVPGSPLIMIDSVRRAEAVARTRRRKDFNIDAQFVFVEQNKATAAYLETVVRDQGYGNAIGSSIHILQGSFSDHFEKVLSHIQREGRTHRVLFLLDQFGYTDVPFGDLRRLFRLLPHAEVILTFAADWLIDYLSDHRESEVIQQKLGLKFPFASISELKEASGDWRRVIQLSLHEQIHAQSGAAFYTPFFIRSVEAHRSYWLVHLSGHSKARDVMASLHWSKHNYFEHYGRPGLKMLGYNPKLDYESQGYRVFGFDPEARSLTIESLLVELPSKIPRSPNRIAYQELFSDISNDTPANSTIIKEVIQQLSNDRELLVFDEHGRLRGSGVLVSANDYLSRPPTKQLRLV